MYWTDNDPAGTPRIFRAGMDGDGPLALISSDLRNPGDLAIDKKGQKLYWTDIEHKRIEYADLESTSLPETFSFIRKRSRMSPRTVIGQIFGTAGSRGVHLFITKAAPSFPFWHRFCLLPGFLDRVSNISFSFSSWELLGYRGKVN